MRERAAARLHGLYRATIGLKNGLSEDVLFVRSIARSEYTKDEVLAALSSLFSAAELTFESERALDVALQLYRTGTAEFADCLHVALAAQAGEPPSWTFDRGASRIAGARLLRR